MNDTSNLRDTIAPKSDQLNADDLMAGPIVVMIVGVRRGSKDQPVIIDIDGGYKPYKPCLSMRRVMITAWGDNGMSWVGKSMALYCDPSVKFGSIAMGGIRISHMSDIKEAFNIMLTTTRARRANYRVETIMAKKVEVTPENRKLWEAAKSRYRLNGDLTAVKKNATITEALEAQLIDEVNAGEVPNVGEENNG